MKTGFPPFRIAILLLWTFLIPQPAYSAVEYFTVDGLKYQTETYSHRATIVNSEDPDIEILTVPDKVTREANGESYNVEGLKNFNNLSNLSKVDLSKATNLKLIGALNNKTLSNNPKLTEIIFPQNQVLTEIYCSFNEIPITEVDLPEGLTTLRGDCFCNCSQLKDVRIPSTFHIVTDNPFTGTELDNCVVLCEESPLKIKNAKRIFSPGFQVEYNGPMNEYDGDTNNEYRNKYFLLLDENTAIQPVVKTFQWEFQSYEVPFAKHKPNEYVIDGTLHSDKDGKCIYSTDRYAKKEMNFTTTERTNPLNITVYPLPYGTTPGGHPHGPYKEKIQKRSAVISFLWPVDDSFDRDSLTMEILENNKRVHAKNGRSDQDEYASYWFKLEDLKPISEYNLKFYFGNKLLYTYSFKTTGLNPSFKKIDSDITTFKGIGSFVGEEEDTEYDEIEEEYITFEGVMYPGKTFSMSGLVPDSDHQLTYNIKLKDTAMESTTFKFKTSGPLKLNTLMPKVVSKSAVIVGAESNLSEKETHAGLEWRKIDAPEEIPSKRAYIIPIDGIMDGRIENIDNSSYYKVRAFYEKYDQSKQWYGEWIGFDPSDFSYFVPTVRTFETVIVEDASADVKGYVLAGTEEITSQGFEYWIDNPSGMVAGKKMAKANEEYNMILANGQIMTATLSDLRPDTEYRFRSFATTDSETTYGEERTFRTPAGAFVTDFDVEKPLPAIEGYYDLHGLRHDEPATGLNIIRYSDGTTRKIIIR